MRYVTFNCGSPRRAAPRVQRHINIMSFLHRGNIACTFLIGTSYPPHDVTHFSLKLFLIICVWNVANQQ